MTIKVNKIYNMDCLEGLQRIKNESIDCIIIDPPYFIDKMGDGWSKNNLEKSKSKAGVVGGLPVGMKFDNKQGERLEEFMTPIASELFRVLKKGGFCLTFSQARLSNRMGNAFENNGFEIRDLLFWKRRSQPKAFSQDHFVRKMAISEEEKNRIIKELDNRKTPQLMQEIEPIIMCQKPRDGTYVNNWLKYGVGLINVDFQDKFPSTIMEFNRDENIEHITPKPVKLIEHLLKIFTKEHDVILDCFMGSGTTAIACINTGRNYIGFELDKGYCDIANERIDKIFNEHNK